MVQLGCALDMMLLWVSAIISLELIALSLGLESIGAPKMTQYTLNAQIYLIVASIFHISAVFGPIGFCFEHDALVGLFYHKSKAPDPIKRFRGPFLKEHFLRGCLLRRHLLRESLFIGRFLEDIS